jgi:hypothetical protein
MPQNGGVSTSGTHDSAGDRTESAQDTRGVPRRRGPRRAVRRGTEREAVLGVPEDERGSYGSNDERLRRDVPPHW